MCQIYKLDCQNIALSIFHGFIIWKIKLFQGGKDNVKQAIESIQFTDTVFWNTLKYGVPEFYINS